jgi:hypothetical protein
MSILFHLRTILFDHPIHESDRLRRAGYYDGEPRPRLRSHWANR